MSGDQRHPSGQPASHSPLGSSPAPRVTLAFKQPSLRDPERHLNTGTLDPPPCHAQKVVRGEDVAEHTVLVGDELGSESMAFNESAPMWVDSTERERAHEIARSVGERLEGRAPLGFGGIQGLVVFEGNCPNTSLPILHRQRKIMEETFKPLFPRVS